jgi:hypothetical protein
MSAVAGSSTTALAFPPRYELATHFLNATACLGTPSSPLPFLDVMICLPKAQLPNRTIDAPIRRILENRVYSRGEIFRILEKE